MSEILVTAGTKYTDIDALACCIAYTELIELEGKKAKAVLPYPFNQSITQEIKLWGLNYSTIEPKDSADYVIMDVSYPDFIPEYTSTGTIIELYDHHTGYEAKWNSELGSKAHIEHIGACATLIWEQYKERRLDKSISTTSARLLYAGIVSNTLNFRAQIVDKRDVTAAQELLLHADLSTNWVRKYFKDQESEIFSNPKLAVREDTKVQYFENLGKNLVVGQLELWNSKDFIETYKNDIEEVMESFGKEEWVFTSPSISEGYNYIYTKNKYIKELLGKFLKLDYGNIDANIATSEKLWLRKELFKQIQSL